MTPPKGNTCYECGQNIYSDQHFCDTQCCKKYKDRYGSKKLTLAIGRQTRLRKKLGLPHFTREEKE